MILVLGATGTIGGEVARQLVAAGERPRLVVRDPEKARARFGDAADVVRGDLDDPASLEAAMRGVDHLFLVAAGVTLAAQEANAIDAAKRAGVRHVVKLSVIGADSPTFDFARWHSASERTLRDSGLGWTMLRPSNFATNALAWAESVKSQGAFYQPSGAGRWSSIDPADVGAVAVAALTKPGHEGQAYELTGPQSLDGDGYAAVLSAVLDRPVTFVDVPPAAAREAMVGGGMPAGYADAVIDLLAAMQRNELDVVTDEVRRITGREPTSFEDWVRRNAAAFSGAA